MTDLTQHRPADRSAPLTVARVAALASLALGGTVLMSWWLHLPTRPSVWPGWARLPVNGGLLFVLLGFALRFQIAARERSKAPGWLPWVGKAAALFVAAFALATLLEYVLGKNFGIDDWPLKSQITGAPPAVPHRLSYPTALSALFLGLGLGLLDLRIRRVWLSQVMAVLSVLIALLALIGYVSNIPEFYGQTGASPVAGMPVHAMIAFLLLGLGLLCARAERGLMAVLWSFTPGGLLARWLILAPALGLLLTGVVYLLLMRLRVDHAIRTWMLGVSNLIFVTVPIWAAAQQLHQVGLERDQAQQELEERVQQRTAELTEANAALHAEIAERRQVEDALRVSEERYRIVADNTYAMEYWLDPLDRLVYVSPSCRRITGYNPAELVQSPALFQTLLASSPAQSDISQSAAAERSHYAEFRWTRRDGTESWVAHHCQPVFDVNGTYLGQRGSVRDITERKQAEEAVREARDRLKNQAVELERRVAERTATLAETIGDLESFSYSVAHDMRAPLRGMQGFARLLLDDYAGKLDENAQQYLQQIARSAARMDQLIQDALSYTQVLRGETPLKRVELQPIVRQLIETVPGWQVPQADIAIVGELPAVLGHDGFLTQCLSNLIANAVKFVAPGVKPCVRIRADLLDATVRVWVEDNGIGIAAKDHDRVFRMFERINRVDEFPGTGIGLAVVRKAVQRMGGRVDFNSELGVGTKFWLELQRAPES